MTPSLQTLPGQQPLRQNDHIASVMAYEDIAQDKVSSIFCSSISFPLWSHIHHVLTSSSTKANVNPAAAYLECSFWKAELSVEKKK